MVRAVSNDSMRNVNNGKPDDEMNEKVLILDLYNKLQILENKLNLVSKNSNQVNY